MNAGEALALHRFARRVMRHPRVSRDELLAWQEERLRAIVRHAGRRVPLYRRAFAEAGVDVEGFRGREDLGALPRLGKRHFRVRRREMLAEGVDTKAIHMTATSGSCGEPFGIWRTRPEARRVALFRRRAHRQMGIGPRDLVCTVTDSSLRAAPSLGRRLRGAIGLGRRGARVSCLLPVAEIAAELERLAPDAIVGYPSALARVGEYLARHGRQRLAPRVVYTGGESRDAEQERRIVAGFGARLYDVYGTIEVDLAAWECAEGSLHWCEDNLVPEILKDGRPVAEGEAGELFVTSLHGETMPLVRFTLGDVVVRGPERCPCGQPFATLGRIEGRAIHYLELPDREPIHPFALTSPLIGEEGHWMDQHQLVQVAPDRLVLRIAPLGTPPPDAEARLVRRAAELLEGRARLEVEWVERFEPGPGGKFHPYVNRLREGTAPPA